MKHTITDTLIHADLIKNKMIRYQFSNQTIDLQIPISGEYEHTILDASILVNIPVTLSYTSLYPDIPVLLDITYNKYSHQEELQVVHTEDKKKLLFESYRAIGGLAMLGIGFTLMFYFVQIPTNSSLIPVVLSILFFAILIGVVLYKSRRTIRNSSQKIVIRTTITEILGIIEHSRGDAEMKKTYYRLANGELIHIPVTGFRVEDRVLIQFMEEEDGSRGVLIEMVKV